MKTTTINALVIFLMMSCATDKKSENGSLNENIRVNQLGYFPNRPKVFILANTEAKEFELVEVNTDKVVYSGDLTDRGTWEASGEQVKSGDFSDYTQTGDYFIQIPGSGLSHSFSIENDIYKDAMPASLKSYYLHRVSYELDEEFAGVYKRPAGHPDDAVLYHPSTGKNAGTKASPGGWYDAGDYGKYIVNAGISVGTMLALFEMEPDEYADGYLNIPESGNGINDLLDEIRFEMDWVLTMQDDDGGVFHKLTTKKFGGFVMPHEASTERYFIGKSTAAALNLAGMGAMSTRIYAEIDEDFSKACLTAAEKAWNWALKNPENYYKNPEDVSTGAYPDVIMDEEFFWAAAELYVTTGKPEYYDYIKKDLGNIQFRLEESWRNFTDNNGYFSLLTDASPLSEDDKSIVLGGLVSLADSLGDALENNPYRVPISHFVWGSNSDILNTAVIFGAAYHYTGLKKYLNLAIETTDYIFGRNAVGYSFLTGFGAKQTMFPHHRPSGADGIDDPLPGFVIGGPNGDLQDVANIKRSNHEYSSKKPARAYIDVEPAFASNEVCINWNAPLVFVLGIINSSKEDQQTH